jgi:thymidylate synthase (FAD)
MNSIKVLDHGFVELVDVLGTDLTVLNSARVSFGKRKTELDESDVKLINYLAKHQHWSPFRHVQLQFHCKVPEFIARQIYKHVVGIAYTEGHGAYVNDHAWNEISMRYVDASEFDYYKPAGFRTQSTDNKQASTDQIVTDGWLDSIYDSHTKQSFDIYASMLKAGVAREQARGVLPLNVYTEFYWTISLQGLANFIKLRSHKGAQYEIREYAKVLYDLAASKFPVSLSALIGE